MQQSYLSATRKMLLQTIQKTNKRFVSKVAIQLDADVTKKLENEEIKPRHHPGINKSGNLSLPKNIVKGILNSIGDYPVKALMNEGNKITSYFKARHPPPENAQIRKKIYEIEVELDNKDPLPNFKSTEMSEEEISHLRQKRENKIKKTLKERVFSWKPIEYGQFEALCYAIGRGAHEYAVLLKIFKEISLRDRNYKPRSYFDFGSGVGTGMWAASQLWKDSIFEYFNVDSSRAMNDLSDSILREGSDNRVSHLKNVFYRQFLPASQNNYDIVISSFSLLELPSKRSRMDVVLNLWRKCVGYMILVEEGTRCGSELINEARDLILGLSSEEDLGHVFSPCPHDHKCPRFSNFDEKIPCNFQISYEQIPIGGNNGLRKGVYSYVVFKKGKRSTGNDVEEIWPRLVRPTLVRARHTICRMCTSNGHLQEIIFTASKHGKFPYRCARHSRWGDRLPISIGENNDIRTEDNK